MKKPHDIDSVDQLAAELVHVVETRALEERRLYKQEVSDLKQLVASKDSTISEQEERLKRYKGVGLIALLLGVLSAVNSLTGGTITRALASLWG